MNIHEYQAKQVLSKYGVSVVKGAVAYTAMEAEAVAMVAEKQHSLDFLRLASNTVTA